VTLLFSTSHFGFLRNFEFAISELARRGHRVRLLADRRDALGGQRMVERLQADFPGHVTVGSAPKLKEATWQPLGAALRLSQDCWRYLGPRYDASPRLRARAVAQAPDAASALARVPLLGNPTTLRALRRGVHALERSLPVAPEVLSLLAEAQPDLLLITPLVYFGTHQVEYVRAARQLGIRSVLCVGSWDHLTTKGLIHEVPDRVVVWNEMQRQEAIELHGVLPEQIDVTGASAYDHWFTTTPSVTRGRFCARAGVRADRPYLLYLCSSPFITPREVEFVERWMTALRSDARAELRDVGVVVRPHPQNADQWRDVDLSRFGNVAIWPRAGENPIDQDARAAYFDSMHYSVAVVGVNTSGLIEAGIVGRMVFTVLDAEFAGTQEGTLHFRHLQNVNGGLLHVARTLEEHCAQLADLVTGRGAADDRARRFVEAFIRPKGLDRPAAEVFADAIEAEGRRGPVPVQRAGVLAPLWHAALYPLAAAARAAALRRRESAQRESAQRAARDKDAPLPEDRR
jgi:hypothetical protein